MSDKSKEVETVNESVSEEKNDDAMNQDQQRIAEWSIARDAAPSEEDVMNLREKIESAQSALDKATAAYEKAVAQRALVIGWTEVAAEEGVSAKRLHSWHRQYVPKAPDLTDVPKTIIPREQRRIASMEERVERHKREEAEAQARAEKFREMMKGWK